jgi:hypothetical protein
LKISIKTDGLSGLKFSAEYIPQGTFFEIIEIKSMGITGVGVKDDDDVDEVVVGLVVGDVVGAGLSINVSILLNTINNNIINKIIIIIVILNNIFLFYIYEIKNDNI